MMIQVSLMPTERSRQRQQSGMKVRAVRIRTHGIVTTQRTPRHISAKYAVISCHYLRQQLTIDIILWLSSICRLSVEARLTRAAKCILPLSTSEIPGNIALNCPHTYLEEGPSLLLVQIKSRW